MWIKNEGNQALWGDLVLTPAFCLEHTVDEGDKWIGEQVHLKKVTCHFSSSVQTFFGQGSGPEGPFDLLEDNHAIFRSTLIDFVVTLGSNRLCPDALLRHHNNDHNLKPFYLCGVHHTGCVGFEFSFPLTSYVRSSSVAPGDLPVQGECSA